MLDKSLFVSDEIHEREIKLADGTTHTLHFKELPAGEFRRFALANDSDDMQDRIDSMPRLIAESVVTPDGQKAITLEQAKQLKPEPMLAIFGAIQEINSGTKKKMVTGASGTS